jgi:hypothetical protein
MRSERRWAVVASVCVLLVLSGCRELTIEEEVGYEPAAVEPIEGSDVSRVILTEDAARRIQLETSPAIERRNSITVPESAIWIDVNGKEWVYANTKPLVFVRARVVVDRYEKGVAYLSRGIGAGTEVATVGVAELIGSEFGI